MLKEKRIAVLKESLAWLLPLLVGSWVIFKDDVFTLVVTLLGGLPGVFLLVASKELLLEHERKIEASSGGTRPKACTKKLVVFLLAYNLIAAAVFFALKGFNLSFGGIVIFVAIEISILAVALISEYFLAKNWPTPSLLLLCSFWDTDSTERK